MRLSAKKSRSMGIPIDGVEAPPAITVAEGTGVPAGSDSRPLTGSAQPALELLEAMRQKHATSVKMLLGQLHGVERALDVAKAKLEAVEEAIAAIGPNG